MRPRRLPACCAAVAASLTLAWGEGSAHAITVTTSASPSFEERLASKEIRRYLYLRTGKLASITRTSTPKDDVVVGIATKEQVLALAETDSALRSAVEALPADSYVLRSSRRDDVLSVRVIGGSGLGALYGAYRLAELLDVRFYLEGDVVPDEPMTGFDSLANLDERGDPAFALRGIVPFHDFPEGPDWWSEDDYRVVVSQLAKMRLNFIGLHTYAEGRPTAEPTVWTGLASDIGPGQTVLFSYPASYHTTTKPSWGYAPRRTSGYAFGAAELFDRDVYGAPIMDGLAPFPVALDQQNLMFERTGALLKGVFEEARRLGVKTCVGTEVPLAIPRAVALRLASLGANVDQLYEGMFERIARTHPLDYYWLWTPEAWVWSPSVSVTDAVADLKRAIAAAEKVKAPFQIATSGWMVGARSDALLLDRELPKSVPMSSLVPEVGNKPVDPTYALIEGRTKWIISWLEDDPGLTIPQLWVGRVQRDASAALAAGASGLFGLHWRTRSLGPQVAALAQLGWAQSDWSVESFYRDWAGHQFGKNLAVPAGQLFARLDGNLPRPAKWDNGPGMVTGGGDYAFVTEFEALRASVSGPANLARFDYWLNSFRYLRAMGSIVENRDALGELYGYLLSTVSTRGEMGTVANWESHILPMLKWSGFPTAYVGSPRLIVPTVRTSLMGSEPLRLEAIVLDVDVALAVDIYWRKLGRGSFVREPMTHVARGVHRASLDQPSSAGDFEYYVRATTSAGAELWFPPGAPGVAQTVVVPDVDDPVAVVDGGGGAAPSPAAPAGVPPASRGCACRVEALGSPSAPGWISWIIVALAAATRARRREHA